MKNEKESTNKLSKSRLMLLLIVALVIVALAVYRQKATTSKSDETTTSLSKEKAANEQSKEQEKSSTTQKNTDKKKPDEKKSEKIATKDRTVTAESGDSYTTLTRSMITDTMQKNHLSLTPAQRVAAETYVVEAVGWPELAVGQTVTITAQAVTAAIDRASKLSLAEQQAWNRYAEYVVF